MFCLACEEEVLAHTTAGVNLEDIMLDEVSQSEEDKRCMVPLM